MKKVLFLLIIAAMAVSSNVNAQGQGNVNIINPFSCNVYANVYAICPGDCVNYYSSQTMNGIPHSPSWPGYTYPIYWLSGHGSAVPAAPPCSEWDWDFIHLDFDCGDGDPVSVFVGNPASPCAKNNFFYPNANNNYGTVTISQACADACFGGKTLIQVSWTNSGSDIDVTIW